MKKSGRTESSTDNIFIRVIDGASEISLSVSEKVYELLMRFGFYVTLPNTYFDRIDEIGQHGFLLVAYLKSRMCNGRAWPTYLEIQKDTGLSSKTVARYLVVLEDAGLIKKARRRAFTNSVYELIFPDAIDSSYDNGYLSHGAYTACPQTYYHYFSEKKIDKYAFMLACYLRFRAKDKETTWPSLDLIMHDLKMNITTLERSIRMLEDVGLLRVTRRHNKVNRYELLYPDALSGFVLVERDNVRTFYRDAASPYYADNNTKEEGASIESEPGKESNMTDLENNDESALDWLEGCSSVMEYVEKHNIELNENRTLEDVEEMLKTVARLRGTRPVSSVKTLGDRGFVNARLDNLPPVRERSPEEVPRPRRTADDVRSGVISAVRNFEARTRGYDESIIDMLNKLPEDIRPLAEVFMRNFRAPSKPEIARWIKDWRKQVEIGIHPIYIKQAIDKMRNIGLTIKAPGSVTAVASTIMAADRDRQVYYSESVIKAHMEMGEDVSYMIEANERYKANRNRR